MQMVTRPQHSHRHLYPDLPYLLSIRNNMKKGYRHSRPRSYKTSHHDVFVPYLLALAKLLVSMA